MIYFILFRMHHTTPITQPVMLYASDTTGTKNGQKEIFAYRSRILPFYVSYELFALHSCINFFHCFQHSPIGAHHLRFIAVPFSVDAFIYPHRVQLICYQLLLPT